MAERPNQRPFVDPHDDHQALCRRVEEASLNAWPAMHQLLLDGWLLRFARGFTKRANSISPIYPALSPVDEKIRYCENLYAREHLETLFRLTSIGSDPGLDDVLDSRGYSVSDRSLVLLRSTNIEAPKATVRFVSLAQWQPIYANAAELPSTAQQIQRVLLGAIRSETGYAVLTDDEGPIACGLAVIDGDLLGLFDIVTHPDRVREGAASEIVRALMRWGADRGASRVYLQMVADNAPAAALYRGLGFETLYHYWYRASG